jgi:hypothetical protein
MQLSRTLPLLLVLGCAVILTEHARPAPSTAKPAAPPADQSPATIVSACELDFSAIEKRIVTLAEAMPEDKFDFTPESLHIPGGAYKGVRTFAAQVKHIAADNYGIWYPLTGQPAPASVHDPNGPDELKSKAEIMKFLRDSFAFGHKAIATITPENELDLLSFRGTKLPRLFLAYFALTHANEHYGQLVVYLRMTGTVPPGSK